MAEKVKSPYETLRLIDVGEHIEKKGKEGRKLSYLSWTWAMDTVKSIYPKSFARMNKTENGMSYYTDGNTCWVDVEYHLIDHDGTEYVEREPCFPIMDYANKSIKLENLTSFDVNTAYQRAVTKCIARHGLGLYIYAGEDLPPTESEDKYTETLKELIDLDTRLKELKVDRHSKEVIDYVNQTAKIKLNSDDEKALDPTVIANDSKMAKKIITVYQSIIAKKSGVDVHSDKPSF